MTAAVGFPTLRLIRVRIGSVHLNDLQAGEVKEVGAFFPIASSQLLIS
jgi:23S rRNA pseudouridine2457 synthase